MCSLHFLRRTLLHLGTALCIRYTLRIGKDAAFSLDLLAGVPEVFPVPVYPHRVTRTVSALHAFEVLFRLRVIVRIRRSRGRLRLGMVTASEQQRQQ